MTGAKERHPRKKTPHHPSYTLAARSLDGSGPHERGVALEAREARNGKKVRRIASHHCIRFALRRERVFGDRDPPGGFRKRPVQDGVGRSHGLALGDL